MFYALYAYTRGLARWDLVLQGSKLRGAKGQNAPKLSPNAPSLWNLGAKFCFPIQPDICFEALQIAPVTVTFAPWFWK